MPILTAAQARLLQPVIQNDTGSKALADVIENVADPRFIFASTPVRVTRIIEGQGAFTSDATAGNRTYTAAEILGGTIVRDCAGAGRSDVLPTAALLVAAVQNATVGDIIRCYITNGSDAAEAITIGAGTGGTFDTNMTATARVIPQNGSRWVTIRLTNVTPGAEAYAVTL